MQPSTNFNRRDFLKSFFRGSALAGLAGAVLVPLARRNAPCQRADACAGCDEFPRCGLPPALERKHLEARATP